jgi:hypothetical protein
MTSVVRFAARPAICSVCGRQLRFTWSSTILQERRTASHGCGPINAIRPPPASRSAMTSRRLRLAFHSGPPAWQLMDLLDAIPELIMRQNNYLAPRSHSSPCVGNKFIRQIDRLISCRGVQTLGAAMTLSHVHIAPHRIGTLSS